MVPADTAAFYASFAAGGLEYGPAYRRVEALWVSETGAEATSRLLPRTNLQRTHVHPADLDGALQSTKVLASGEGASGQIRLPFSIDTALLRGKASGPLWAVRARPRIGAHLNPHKLPPTPTKTMTTTKKKKEEQKKKKTKTATVKKKEDQGGEGERERERKRSRTG